MSTRRINCVICAWMQIRVLVFMANSLFLGIDITLRTHASTLAVTTLPKYKSFSSENDIVCKATPSSKWGYCMCESAPYNGVIIHYNHTLTCLYLCLPFFSFWCNYKLSILSIEYCQNYYSQQERKIIFLKDFKKNYNEKKITMKFITK